MEERRAERKLREAEQEARRIEQEQSNRKWEAECEDRKAEVRLKEAEFALKRDEAAKQDTNVCKSKIFRDAMRSSAIRMSNDPIEAVAFFMNVEHLFDVYNVPTDFKALLIRPYLNDKAKSIVSKLTPEVAGDYSRSKDALLHEFKLSPNTYLERLNTCCKGSEETFVDFASKSKGLLDYYLNSRYVTDFAQLCELLVCDRIKSTLTNNCLQYVLPIESSTKNGWMSVGELTSSIDRYQQCSW